ncbi:MAG TPA: TIM44-like domain-containing protein [Kofleriaceae bacterium]|nr:TIM44-like domain-containing protein [Kofleriaceae bacterium]
MTAQARRPRWWPWALVALLVLARSAIAVARPGGGESYSGGGGHGGSGGGGDGGGSAIFELVFWLLRLVIIYPAVGLPILAVVIGYVLYSAYRQRQNKDWDSGPPIAPHRAITLSDVRQIDPDFSQVVFEDFAFRLFSTAHRARHTAETLATIAPYVAEPARAALAARAPVGEPVVQVVVGALRTYRVDVPAGAGDAAGAPRRVRVGIEYEANIATARQTYYCVESWLFGRDAAVRSKPPGATRTFPCPNCGAPWQATDSGTQVCASCGQVVDNGRFDWVIEQISLTSCDERPPTLTTEVPERGTDLPTYRQPDADAAWLQLTRDDPQITDDAFQARLAMIYDQLNRAWAHNDLAPIRGLVSDGLYDYLSYWVEAYRRQGLRNVLADMRITHTALARLARDRYYDAATIRIWATGKDYVIREPGGEHVRGSRGRDRAYSEYWTLIRTAQRKGPPLAAPACGNCGAPLQITQSGQCEHCGAHVTAGEFDWVVSRIEQDDSYRG